MATSTIVITYTPATTQTAGPGVAQPIGTPIVTSLTESGTAYASLTADQVQKAYVLMKKAQAFLAKDKGAAVGFTPGNITS